MNHQRILPLPTSINIYIISVWFVFCHCPQALHFTKSDQFPFRFRVSRIYWRRGWARPEFWRVQLRGKERVFIGPDRRFYTAHKRSFLFFTKMWFRFRVDVFYCGLPFSKLIFCVFNLTLLTGRRFRLFRFLDFVSGLMYFIGFQEIHFEFLRVQLRGKKRLFDLPKGRINVTQTDRRQKIVTGRGRLPDRLKSNFSSRILRFCSLFAVLGGLQNSLPVGLFARELRNTKRGAIMALPTPRAPW